MVQSVDLSGIIFAALAVAWAVYLIPKALRHHDEMAKARSVDRFSHSMRVLGRNGAVASRRQSARTAGRPEPREVVKPPAATTAPAPRRPAPSREAARRAAARRRRVLGMLLLAVAVVAVLAWRMVVPWWSVAIPVGLVVLFLVIARLTVRRERVRVSTRLEQEDELEVDEGREDTVEVDREELAAAVAAPLADEGSLWDPLPLTLPTYVHKAHARRTVKTIELTQTAGVISSGHDAGDSALVAAAEEAAAEVPTEQRKVAGA